MSSFDTASGIAGVALVILFIAWIAMLSLGGAGLAIGLFPVYGLLWTLVLIVTVLKL